MQHKLQCDAAPIIRTVNSEWLLNGHTDLRNTTIVEIDLSGSRIDWSRFKIDATTLFIGCRLPLETEIQLRKQGANLLSAPENLPYRPLRQNLYGWQELMEGYSAEADNSIDLSIYQHFEFSKSHPNLNESLWQRLHDYSMDEALRRLLQYNEEGLTERRSVGFMGGHGTGRDTADYQRAARTAKLLTEAGYFVVSGGGPGIMEAANLGAYLAHKSEAELTWALQELASAPKYTDQGYHEAAFRVIDRFPEGAESLAIPTWFYGHEPSNLFGTYIAKYFSNSIREDTLLAVSYYGIVYAAGSAGTTQEIFQEAAQNHYVTFDFISPMVFLGRRRYQIETMIYPLLRQLAYGRDYFDFLHITDHPEEVVAFLRTHPPLRK